jgi:hypothetical protein
MMDFIAVPLQWEQKADMRNPKSEICYWSYGRQCICVGGLLTSKTFCECEVCNPEDDS